MNANDAQFLPFLGTANAQFVIPVYQRLYSWTTRRRCSASWVTLRSFKPPYRHFGLQANNLLNDNVEDSSLSF